jgi:hypothetical protein
MKELLHAGTGMIWPMNYCSNEIKMGFDISESLTFLTPHGILENLLGDSDLISWKSIPWLPKT